MSRIGRMPITVPAGVEVSIAENNVVTVKGPKGTLTQALRPEMILEQDGNTIHVKRPSDDKLHCALHGMTRALLHNMVVGVSEGFKKELEINGVGYRAAKEGNELVMNLGYSHPVKMAEILAMLPGVCYSERVTVNTPARINQCKKALKHAFELQLQGKGMGFVEVLSPCPTGWGMSAVKALDWIDEKMTEVVSGLSEADFHEAGEGLGILKRLPPNPDAAAAREQLTALQAVS